MTVRDGQIMYDLNGIANLGKKVSKLIRCFNELNIPIRIRIL